MKGYLQVYTGDGKGKTTAAMGLAIRAAGSGKKSYIGQFMKGQKYGESQFFENVELIEIEQFGESRCIRKEEVSDEYKSKTKAGLLICREKMLSGDYDIVILDEINVSVWFGLLDEKDVLEFIKDRPDNVELVFTGRYAPETIIEKADLVTEMRCIKHYFNKGVNAREGIEK